MHARLFNMNLFRYQRKLMALFGVAAMLFAQFAMAAHVCMEQAPAQAVSLVAAMDGDNAPCHDHESEPVESNACVVHCQAGVHQSLELQPAPAAVFVHALVLDIDRSEKLAASIASQSYAKVLLTRITAPPAMVRNCCLRT